MATKNPGFFSKLFSRKKSNKENELPESHQEQFYRTQSVRGSRRPHRTSHFEEGYSPEYPNPYHGNVKPRKHPRGPQSCPGGVRDESYHDEQHYEESRSQYGRAHPRHEKFRRSARDTSEYGSGDPSPITMSSRHHYNTSLIDDSETEDYRGESRVSKYNDLEKQCELWREKCEHANFRKDYYKAGLRKMKDKKDQIEDAFNDRMTTLKAENERLRQQLGVARAELSRYQQQHQQQYNSFGLQNSFFQPPPPTQQMFPSAGYANFLTPRASVPTHHAPMPGSNLTAGTSSTLESTLAGAGEALAQPSDMSFQPQFDSSFSAKSFADEDEENVKNFSNFTFDEKLEAPRANVSTSSLGINPQREIRLVRQSDESHASSSTVVADEMYPPSKSGSESTLRRTASDGILN